MIILLTSYLSYDNMYLLRHWSQHALGKTMKYASTKAIQTFLQQCKQIIASKDIIPSTFVSIRSKKNKNTMLELGFTDKQLIEVLEELTLKDYAEGPCNDRDYHGTIWIFGKCIENREIYIKLKVSEMDNQGNKITTLICLSFHFSEKPLMYPYKEEEK